MKKRSVNFDTSVKRSVVERDGGPEKHPPPHPPGREFRTKGKKCILTAGKFRSAPPPPDREFVREEKSLNFR